MSEEFDLCVIGAGAAGMMAAATGARGGLSVCVLERNTNPGRKLLITGGGRCNLTHAGSIDDFVQACQPYGHTLKPAFYAFSPEQTLVFFHERGLETYIDEAGCVFPISERAGDVHRILVEQMQRSGVTVQYAKPVKSVEKQGERFLVMTESGTFRAKAVLVTTGGASWPRTGSTGDGYRIAEQFGHTIEPPVGILCPMAAKEPWPSALQGVSLDNVNIRLKVKSKPHIFSGELVFTADGIGGPVVFDVSRVAAELLKGQSEVVITLDFWPGQSPDQAASILIEQCAANPKKEIAGILSQWFPKRLGAFFQECACGTHADQGCNLPREHRRKLVDALKATPLTLIGSGPLEKATVTRGGVFHKEIDPQTMQSRLCEGLYFAGEVVDVDGPCGGYNLQIAFSTGVLAGRAIARNL